MEAHHCVNGPDTRRNSRGRRKKGAINLHLHLSFISPSLCFGLFSGTFATMALFKKLFDPLFFFRGYTSLLATALNVQSIVSSIKLSFLLVLRELVKVRSE